METEVTNTTEFAPGSSVFYFLHGRCNVLGIEKRMIEGNEVAFYKLEIQKPAFSRSTRKESAIFLPVNSAKERGLHATMSQQEVDAVLAIFANREYYFNVNENWGTAHSKMEDAIRTEGFIGLAKAVSYLHVLKRKLVVFPPQISKFEEQSSKLLFRELSQVTGETMRSLEEKAQKLMRHKLAPDQ